MRAAPLLIAWHDDKAPIYSVQFQPHGSGRLATAGGDNNIRLWDVEANADERKVTYLSTLHKHVQAVNVVRWHPRDELLASGGDDGNVLLWAQSKIHAPNKFGEEDFEDKETWMVKKMCKLNANPELGIYDLAWSPDGLFFVTGSTDNVARIFDAQTGTVVRQIAEHNHFVQGVAWDPLNEYLATQSSDRSVHIYKLQKSNGHSALEQPSLYSKMSRMEFPPRRPSSNSPAPPDFGHRAILSTADNHLQPHNSPAPSAPGTPTYAPLPMNPPPPSSHSRQVSFGNSSPAIHRSPSPAPSMPLPAVMPPASPGLGSGLGVKSTNIYANETLTSFFRRLTFAPDGSLLFTPAGQYKNARPTREGGKVSDEVVNTVYIYSRAGLNKPPIAHLPGHKKPSVAVRCSPVLYNLRLPAPTRNVTIDTSSSTEDIPPLPEPAMPNRAPSITSMDPPPPAGVLPSPAPSTSVPSPKSYQAEPRAPPDGPPSAFALPYRVIYAAATQDAVFVYDTQQQSPLCIVSNLHFATFTDLTWSNDGTTLLMSSSDGFCSALSFAPGELGSVYQGQMTRARRPSSISISGSNRSTPQPTPTTEAMPPLPRHPTSGIGPSPSPIPSIRPPSPTRSNSTSSVATQSSFAHPSGVVISNPTPSVSNLPSVAASSANAFTGPPALTSPTPPLTPLHHTSVSSYTTSTGNHAGPAVPAKREGEDSRGAGVVEGSEPKKRRIAPTLVSDEKSE